MLRCLCLLAFLIAAPAEAARVALVIGNSAYQNTPKLANAEADARDMAARLGDIGFEVVAGYDLTRTGTLQLVEEFARRLDSGDVALLYYAGHGAQLGRENYLIPVDATISDADGMAAGAVKLQAILRTMELRAGTRLVILDACRDNPFVDKAVSRSGAAPARGLAKIDAGVGSFIAFSTQPGNVASDGTARNSPFTAALLTHMATPGQDIHAVMRQVRADVHQATGGRQIPWENSSLVREVFLVPGTATPQPAIATPAPQPAPTPQPAPAPALPVVYHYVDGLDPNGDNFLALRSAPAGQGYRLDRMGPGTLLEVLGQQGNWMQVRLRDGRLGWAHGRWIHCCRQAGAAPAAQGPRTTQPAAQSCEALWYARNSVWHRYGYCFRGARGKRTFGNAGCSRDQAGARAAMSRADAAEVDRLVAEEKRLGCR